MGMHKIQRMALALTLLEQYHKEGDEFLNHTVQVTGDKTWTSFVNVETKEQSKQWINYTFTRQAEKFKQTFARKLMAAVFWDRKGVLMVEFMQQGITVTLEAYCKKLKNCIGPFRMRGVKC
jgi:acyl-CoA thioesterase